MEAKKVHFMGIGGAGVSAVAAFAKNAGFEVSGCDLDNSSRFLDKIKSLGVKVEFEHSPAHLEAVDLLVVSPAIESLDPDNTELKEAKEKNIPIEIGEKFLAQEIIKGKKLIAVSGTHGKSTTTAMVGEILEKAGLDPNVLVGAIVNDWNSNFRLGKGEYFVIEADEYQEKFLLYNPEIAVITALEMDHPEYFENFEQVKETFERFAGRVKKDLVLGKGIEFRIQNSEGTLGNVALANAKVRIERLGRDFEVKHFNLRLIGEFNQENATLAFEVGKLLGIDKSNIIEALEKFNGIGRRFEFKGEEKGVRVFEDYAHHPTAIKLTTEAIREKFPDQKIWIVYQPHMYSRTKYLFYDFVETFKNLPTDQILLLPIFAARQENAENISSQDLVNSVHKDNVKYLGGFVETVFYLVKNLSVGDIVVVMGAGDCYKLTDLLLKKLANKI